MAWFSIGSWCLTVLRRFPQWGGAIFVEGYALHTSHRTVKPMFGSLRLLLNLLLALILSAQATPPEMVSVETFFYSRIAQAPAPTIEAYVRPGLAARMARLRPAMLRAAHRHNRQAISKMSDTEFAAVIAMILYNEQFGWLEDDIAPLRGVTPYYQELQRQANQYLPGSNFSIWPANLRPSVALEILNQELPLPNDRVMKVPIRVDGSQIDPQSFRDRAELWVAINSEISRDDMAVAYLAANLERGLLRAAYEGTPVSWRTLAAWHNQGIVDPQQIRANPTARDYVRRATAYLPLARALVGSKQPPLVGIAA